jgi:hypothetical protein
MEIKELLNAEYLSGNIDHVESLLSLFISFIVVIAFENSSIVYILEISSLTLDDISSAFCEAFLDLTTFHIVIMNPINPMRTAITLDNYPK